VPPSRDVLHFRLCGKELSQTVEKHCPEVYIFAMEFIRESSEKEDYWIEIARYDLSTAHALLKAHKYLYVGFMCHQAIEKGLKALYVARKKKIPPFIHNLIVLAEQTGVSMELSEDQRCLIDRLQPLNIQARYPSYRAKMMKELTKNSTSALLRETRAFFKWLTKRS
jgi:HEPN domain-containing protein